ncbi:hypothetical protein [Paenibacillus sp. LPE1-1-1.1]|uniref:hypothetical protein n=1 Tax=Paenibacillus sp. LPE1-1-1.1 TaxID=3135230 RepID=UPI0034244D8D
MTLPLTVALGGCLGIPAAAKPMQSADTVRSGLSLIAKQEIIRKRMDHAFECV